MVCMPVWCVRLCGGDGQVSRCRSIAPRDSVHGFGLHWPEHRDHWHNCLRFPPLPVPSVRAHAAPPVFTEIFRGAGLELRVVEIPHPCSNEDYEASFRAVATEAERRGVAHMAFGDLFLEDVRRYRESLLAATSVEGVFPLWPI